MPGLLVTLHCSYPGGMAGAVGGANNLGHLDEIAVTSWFTGVPDHTVLGPPW